MPDSDGQLIERLKTSDSEAFRLLFEKYQPILFRSLLHRLRDADAAHDVVQETFLRVWQRRLSLQPHLSFLAYLFRISRNLVLDQAKFRDVRRRLEPEVPAITPSSDENPEASLRLKILQENVSEIVRLKLPDKCREMFLLSRMEGMSNSEISVLLGVSPKTVENQITRALKVLRRHLRQYREL